MTLRKGEDPVNHQPPLRQLRREEQARATRLRILDTAERLVLDGGYAAMTVAGLAEGAGVSVQTVYNAIGGKAAVVKALYDVRLAGDDEPVPMSQRPMFRRITEADSFPEGLARYATASRVIYERVGALVGVLLAEGPGGDSALGGLRGHHRAGAAHGQRPRRRRHDRALRRTRGCGARRARRRGVDPHRARGRRPPRAPLRVADHHLRDLAGHGPDHRAGAPGTPSAPRATRRRRP